MKSNVNTTPMVKKDIFIYGGKLLFTTKEEFAIQALTAPNQEFLYSKQMGMNDLSYFQGENANKLAEKTFNNVKNETCFFVVLRNNYTTKLKQNGIRLDKFDLSYEGYKYGEITIKIEGVRFSEVYR